jgi:hypothetical protein
MSEAFPIHKLRAMRILEEEMRSWQQWREESQENGDDPVETDRSAAQMSLTAVIRFLQHRGFVRGALIPLLADLVTLSDGQQPSRMLQVSLPSHRPADHPVVALTKGRLAAIMEYRQITGSTRKEARDWVVDHLPASMKKKLNVNHGTTVDSWLAKWGGEFGTPSDGRDGYVSMKQTLEAEQPTETDLVRIMAKLESYLPA